MDLMQMVLQQLSGGGVREISNQIGADEDTTGQAVQAAVPVLISALAKNSSREDGAQALQNALVKDHDGSILDNLSGYLNGGSGPSSGPAILGHVLGNRQPQVENALSQKTGLDAASIGRILAMLAPIIMGALGKAQSKNGFDPGSLGGYLNGQKEQAQSAAPDVMSMLTGMLDSNKDGSVIDDLGGIAKKLLGGQ